MKFFITIASAHCCRDRREAVRATWLLRLLPNMTARFFVGWGPAVTEPGVVQLDVHDGYFELWEKVQEAMRYALDFEWDYYFKCDDDTYLVPERLEAALNAAYLAPAYLTRKDPRINRPERQGSEPEYVGCECPEAATSLYGQGGAGYFLSRRVVEFILQHCAPCNDKSMYEDGWIGLYARKTTRFYATPHLYHNLDRQPLPDNQLATCHRIYGMEEMVRVHRQFVPTPV